MKDIEVFDTFTDKFLPTNYFGKLSQGRCNCGMIDINGVVYIIGGFKRIPNGRTTQLIPEVETFNLKSRISMSQDIEDTKNLIKVK